MRKILIIFISCLLFKAVYSQSAADYSKSANQKFLKRDLGGAINDYTKAISLNPNDFNNYKERARCYNWASQNKHKDIVEMLSKTPNIDINVCFC